MRSAPSRSKHSSRPPRTGPSSTEAAVHSGSSPEWPRSQQWPCPELSPEARDFASRPHGRKFAAIAYPVAVGTASGEIVQPGRMIIGGVFSSFLHSVVKDVLESPFVPAGH